MKAKRIWERAGLILLIFIALPACADTVELDLFTIGCPTLFDPDHSWSSDIDLGVQFSSIDSVYIDWAGEITAGLAVDSDDPENPYPLDVGIKAYFLLPVSASGTFWGGEASYPSPEPFDTQTGIGLSPIGDWESFLDGSATLSLYYTEYVFGIGSGWYVEHGSVSLTSAVLVIEGIVVPEPATILFTVFGGIFLRKRANFKKAL